MDKEEMIKKIKMKTKEKKENKLKRPVNWEIIKALKGGKVYRTTELGEKLNRTIQTISSNLIDLVEKGYLNKIKGKGRAIYYSLTDKGEKVDFSEQYEKLKHLLYRKQLSMKEYLKIKEIMKMETDDKSKLYWINKKVFGEV